MVQDSMQLNRRNQKGKELLRKIVLRDLELSGYHLQKALGHGCEQVQLEVELPC